MGKSYTPTYRAEYKTQTGDWRLISWNVRGGTNRTAHGVPNERNAELLRKALNKSFAPGGVNYHVSKAAGYIVSINRLRVIHQASNQVVAETVAPMFEVV